MRHREGMRAMVHETETVQRDAVKDRMEGQKCEVAVEVEWKKVPGWTANKQRGWNYKLQSTATDPLLRPSVLAVPIPHTSHHS